MKSLILIPLIALMAGNSNGVHYEMFENSSEPGIIVPTTQSSSESSQDEIDKAASVLQDDEVKAKIEDILSNWLSPDKIAMVMTWLGYLTTIIVLASKLKSLNSKNQLTLDNVKKAILESLGDKVNESVKSQIGQYFGKLQKSAEDTNELVKEFAKVIALAQAGDKKGVLDALVQISAISSEKYEEVRQEVEHIQAKEEEKKAEVGKKLESIEKDKPLFDGTSI